MPSLKKTVKSLFSLAGIGLSKPDSIEKLLKRNHDLAEKLDKTEKSHRYYELLKNFPRHQAPKILDFLEKSQAQFLQDIFVLSELSFKTSGFFVDFGATNGVNLSNSFLLEKEFGWNGILAEPARCWHEALKKNRRASIETRCVWKQTDSTLTFNEVHNSDLSTISSYSESDRYSSERKNGQVYEVETISLNDLLEKHQAPRKIDYLSIDTEGSEFDILKSFDFDKYSIQVITCEHNYTAKREEIYKLLKSKGYVRKYPELSEVDDWYVLEKN